MKNSKEMIHPKLESKLAGIRRVFQSNPFLKRTLPFIIGALALVWFLIRVIPKPQRASYPCMKVTYPLMSGLVIWILGITSISASVKLFFNNLRNKKYLFALGAVVMFAGLSIFFSLYHSEFWPKGIVYDPDNSGTPIPSLGVHEHWNNPVDKN